MANDADSSERLTDADPRGYTYTEAWRHECEVRHVLKMATRQQRAEYLDGVERKRGKAPADRLRRDVATAWRAAREKQTPHPLGEESGVARSCAVHLSSERGAPGFGSFLSPGQQGAQTRAFRVDSGAPER
jgi:hypothetical protein